MKMITLIFKTRVKDAYDYIKEEKIEFDEFLNFVKDTFELFKIEEYKEFCEKEERNYNNVETLLDYLTYEFGVCDGEILKEYFEWIEKKTNSEYWIEYEPDLDVFDIFEIEREEEIFVPVYYYEDEKGNKVIDEELMLKEFKTKLEKLKGGL